MCKVLETCALQAVRQTRASNLALGPSAGRLTTTRWPFKAGVIHKSLALHTRKTQRQRFCLLKGSLQRCQHHLLNACQSVQTFALAKCSAKRSA